MCDNGNLCYLCFISFIKYLHLYFIQHNLDFLLGIHAGRVYFEHYKLWIHKRLNIILQNFRKNLYIRFSEQLYHFQLTFNQQVKCIAECDDGTFGYDCRNNCSTNCLNELPCNKKQDIVLRDVTQGISIVTAIHVSLHIDVN